jgi:hypothetical protein
MIISHTQSILTLSKLPLQQDFALDSMIPPFVFHFSNICHVTTRKPRLPQCIMGDEIKSDSHETWKCADPELEKQIRCFPYA